MKSQISSFTHLTCNSQGNVNMGLSPCKDCGELISSDALKCPHCGARTAKAKKAEDGGQSLLIE